MSQQEEEKSVYALFDITFFWSLPRDCCAAYILSLEQVKHGRGTETLSPYEIASCKGKRVLLCGTYYTNECVGDLSLVAKSVTCYVHSEDELNKYHYQGVQHTTDPYPAMVGLDYPWLKHIIRRTSPQATAEDEFFYRGLLRWERARGNHESSDAFRHWIKFNETGPDCDNELLEKFCRDGETAMSVKCEDAEDVVRLNSRIIACGTNAKCRLVLGSVAPVMPTVEAAYDMKDGNDGSQCGMSISVRPWVDGRYSVTWFSKHVDLEFLLTDTYRAGGKEFCRGKTFAKGDFVYSADAATLEEMIHFDS